MIVKVRPLAAAVRQVISDSCHRCVLLSGCGGRDGIITPHRTPPPGTPFSIGSAVLAGAAAAQVAAQKGSIVAGVRAVGETRADQRRRGWCYCTVMD